MNAQCRAGPPAEATPFDSLKAQPLAGTYRLTMVSQVPGARRRSTSGRLLLWVPDTLFQYYELGYEPTANTAPATLIPSTMKTLHAEWRRRARPLLLQGASTVRLDDLDAPGSSDLRSRDPLRPGLRLAGAALLFAPRLGWKPVDGEWTKLLIERVDADGFWGAWFTTFDRVVRRDAQGHPLDAPHGYYCAERER